MKPPDPVDDVLRAIVAGESVDWTVVESSHTDESSRHALRDLKLVAEIAAFNRLHGPEDTAIGDRFAAASGPVGATWGPLTVVEQIGQGSFGDVYRAWDGRLDREVALKVLREADSHAAVTRSRAVGEGRLLARVRHPNVVTVHGADVVDGNVGIWMEFVRGRTLESIVGERGPFDESEAITIGVAICRALGAVHRAGLVHRDIKAQNVMREDDGRVVLMDFGTGYEIQDARIPGLAGTPVYVAPEVLAGDPATPASDCYSLGVLLFYLTTGTYPVQASTVGELRLAHQRGSRQRLATLRPDLSAPFVEVVERAVAPRAANRFESTEALDRALSKVAAGLDPATAHTQQQAAPPWLARAAALVAVIVLTVLATTGPFLRPSRTSDDATSGGSRSGAGAAAGVLTSGPSVRRVDVGRFIASGEPSRSGQWIAGVDWDAGGNLARLDLLSGDRRVLTTKPAESGEFTGRTAVSGDERRIAYSWYFSTREDIGELRTIDIDGLNARTVVRNPEGAISPVAWAPDGRRVLVVRERPVGIELAWVAVDDGRVATLATLPTFPRGVSLSPDGGLIAFDLPSTTDDATRDIHVGDATTGRTWPVLAGQTNDLSPVWAPTGTGFVFSSNRGGNLGLWFLPVTRDGTPAGEPVLMRGDMGRFAPIGFGRDAALFYHATTGTVDVFVAPIELGSGRMGRPATVATRYVGTNLYSDWSPDGHSLVFTSRRGEVGFERGSQVLVIRDLTTSTERVFTPDVTGLIWPRWAPDGRSVVFKGEGRAGPGFYRVSLDDGSITLMLAHQGSLPEWRPDGREWLFVVEKPPFRAIQALDVVTGAQRTVVDRGYMFAVSRDGERLAFARQEAGRVGIHVASISGGEVRPLLTLGPNDRIVELAGWSPDNTELVVARTERDDAGKRGAITELLAVPTQGGAPRTLARVEYDGMRSIRLSPDGTRLAFEAGWPAASMWVLERFMK